MVINPNAETNADISAWSPQATLAENHSPPRPYHHVQLLIILAGFILLLTPLASAYTICGQELSDNQIYTTPQPVKYTTVGNGLLWIQQYAENNINENGTNAYYAMRLDTPSTHSFKIDKLDTVSSIPLSEATIYEYDRGFICETPLFDENSTINDSHQVTVSIYNLTKDQKKIKTNNDYALSFTKQNWLTGQFNLTINSSTDGNFESDPDISACGTISSAGTYTLTTDISGADTCLIVTAENVVIDGAGHQITYSTTSATGEYGIWLQGANYTTIKNVSIRHGGFHFNDYPIYIDNSQFSNATDVTATTFGSNCHALYLTGSNNFTVNNLAYTSSDSGSIAYAVSSSFLVVNNSKSTGVQGNLGAIHLITGSTNANITNNQLFTSGDNAKGVYISGGSNHYIFNNSIRTTGAYTYGVYAENSATLKLYRNYLNATSTNTNARGLYLSNTPTNTNISTNQFFINRNTNGRGILVDGATGILIDNNNISVGGGASAEAIFLYNNANTNVTNNNITANGTVGIGTNAYQRAWFINNTINATTQDAYAIQIAASSVQIFSENNIFYAKNKTWMVQGSTNQINSTNDTFNVCAVGCAAEVGDAFLEGTATVGFLNSTLRENNTGYGAGNNKISTRNFLQANTTYANGTIVRATVNASDNLNTNVMNEIVGTNGLSSWRVFRSFAGNKTVNQSWLPLNITANHSGGVNTTLLSPSASYRYDIIFPSGETPPTPPDMLVLTLNAPANAASGQNNTIDFSYIPIGSFPIQSAIVWSNWSGVWSANNSNATGIVNNSANTITVKGIPYSNFTWNVYACTNTSVCAFDSSNHSFSLLGFVNTTLYLPPNGNVTNNQTIDFNYTVNTTYIPISATLWSNWSGTWSANNSNASLLANVGNNTITARGIPFSTFVWNVLVCTNNGGCSFDYTGNHTVIINPLASLIVNLTAPADGGNSIVPSALFIANATSANALANATLYGNFDGTWKANATTTGNANFSFTLGGLKPGSYLWNVRFCDTSGVCAFDTSGNHTVNMILTNAPNVLLVLPLDGGIYVTPTVLFSATATSAYVIANSTMYGNFSGTWSKNVSQGDASNYSQTLNSLAPGVYGWNVQFCDQYGQCLMAASNRTFRVVAAALPLIVNLTLPANGAIVIGDRKTFVANATSGLTIQNSTLWTNFTGSWTANVTQSGSANFTQLITGVTKGVYRWNVLYCDSQNCTFDTSGNNTVDFRYYVPPTVNLTTPANQSTQVYPVTFTATALSNYSLANFTLWGNFSGSWAANDTFTGNANLSDLLASLGQGVYFWNAYACDFYGQCKFDTSSNFTVQVTTTTTTTTTTSTTTTTLAAAAAGALNKPNEFYMLAAIIILGLILVFLGYWEDLLVLKILGASILLIASMTIFTTGYSIVMPYAQYANASTCTSASNATTYAAYNWTSLNTTCNFTIPDTPYQEIAKNDLTNVAWAVVLFLLSVGIYLEVALKSLNELNIGF